MIISAVFNHSPADKAGLNFDDKFSNIVGLEAQSVRQITNFIRSREPGDLYLLLSKDAEKKMNGSV